MSAFYEWLAALARAGKLPSIFEYPFFARGLIAVLLMAPLLGGLSHVVVARRLAFLSTALGQAALTGLTIGIVLGEPLNAPYGGIFGFCSLAALAMVYIKRHSALPNDTLIGVFLSFLLAVPRAGRMLKTEFVVTRDRVIHERVPEDEACSRMLIFGLEGEMFFGASTDLENHLASIEERVTDDLRVGGVADDRPLAAVQVPEQRGVSIAEVLSVDRTPAEGIAGSRFDLDDVRTGVGEELRDIRSGDPS